MVKEMGELKRHGIKDPSWENVVKKALTSKK